MSLMYGMTDRLPDFNKTETDEPPASWTLAVQGRPSKAKDEMKKGGDKKGDGVQDSNKLETDEDLVCACCFDGTSIDVRVLNLKLEGIRVVVSLR